MNLFVIIKNLFKHHKINTNEELVRPLDLVKIPKRKEFNNDSLVDYYKDEYNNILSSMKDYDTLILEADELNYNIKMVIELLFSISIKEDEIKEKSVEDRINYLINSEKLDLYKNDINNLQSEVIGRLIAISEIRKELFLSKKKKESIDNIINRLCLSLNTLYSIEISIIKNIERYKNESKYSNEPRAEEKEKEYEIINEKIKHLNWLQEILPEEEQVKVRDDINYILKDIASVEKQLEEYTYIHKDEITEESKNEEINNILEIPFDIEHKEELLKRIKEIERKYRVFYEYREYQEYGDIVINESDLTSIYNLKFSSLTISKDGIVESFINDETDKIEIEYYKNIIFSMIQNIILGKNEYFNELFDSDLEKASVLLIEGLKNNSDNIDYGHILRDKYLLNLLLALEKSELPSLYDNYKDHMLALFEVEPLPFYFDGGFYLSDYIPLKTFFFFKENVTLKKYDSNELFFMLSSTSYKNDSFVDFYKLFFNKVNKDSDKYYLPDGIEVIDRIAPHNKFDTFGVFDAISNNSNNKTVILPNSLKKIVGSLFNANCQVNKVVLNEGLVHLQKDVFYNQKFDSITIPSTIEYIESSVFNFETLKSMKFNNMKLSKFLPLSYELFKDNFTTLKIDNMYKSKLEKIIFHYDNLATDIEIELSYIGGSKYDKFTNNYYLMNSFFAFIFRQIYNELIERLNNLQVMLNLFKQDVNFEELEASLFDIPEESGVAEKLEELLDKVIKAEKTLDEFINNNYDKSMMIANDLKNKFHLLANKERFYENKETMLEEVNNLITNCQNNYHMPYDFNEDILEPYKEKYLFKIKEMVIDNKYFDRLYCLKLNILRLNTNGISEIFYDKVKNEEERQYYKDIINRRINILFEGVQPTLEKISKEDYDEVLKVLKNIFTDKNDNNKCEEVLNDYFLFNFLHALLQDDWNPTSRVKNADLNNLFQNITYNSDLIIKNEEELNKEGIFTYDKNYITLGSALILKHFKVIKGNLSLRYRNKIIDIPDDLEKFYDIYRKYYIENDYYFYLPEGISKIKNMSLVDDSTYLMNCDIDSYNRDTYLIDYIKKNAQNKGLVLPKSLREIEGNIDIPLHDVTLNEGLTSLKGSVFASQNFDSIMFPYTIKEIDENAFNIEKLQTIIIREDALVENGEEYLQEILKGMHMIETNYYRAPYAKHSYRVRLDLNYLKILLNNGEEMTHRICEVYLHSNEFAVLRSRKDICIHHIYKDIMERIELMEKNQEISRKKII